MNQVLKKFLPIVFIFGCKEDDNCEYIGENFRIEVFDEKTRARICDANVSSENSKTKEIFKFEPGTVNNCHYNGLFNQPGEFSLHFVKDGYEKQIVDNVNVYFENPCAVRTVEIVVYLKKINLYLGSRCMLNSDF